MKTKKYHAVRTVSKSNRKIVDYKDNIDTTNTHDCLLSWCFIGLSIISFVAKLVLLAKASPVLENNAVMQVSFTYEQHVVVVIVW